MSRAGSRSAAGKAGPAQSTRGAAPATPPARGAALPDLLALPPPSAAPAGLLGRWLRVIRLGMRSLWLHRLRSLLTVLGIVFGVCSVIAMLAIGEGASFAAQEQIKSLGSQNIILRSIKPPFDQKLIQSSRQRLLSYGLTYADIRAIQATIPGVMVVVPGRTIQEFVWNIGQRVDSEIVGTVPWYPEMRNHRVAQGRFFTDLEMDEQARVCVLNPEAAEKLFPLEAPLGKSVRIGEHYYRVVGVLEHQTPFKEDTTLEEKQTASTGSQVFLPLESLKTHFGDIILKRRVGSFEIEKVVLSEVTVKVDKREAVIDVSLAIKDLLDRKHTKPDYRMTVPLQLLARAEETKRIFTIVLGSIAAISLLVGGIGIMNIMLASVTERTREIGIRRSLGARRRDIVRQFLVETVILAGAGGLLGVVLGMAIPRLVTLFSGMPTIIVFWAPILAFGISALVGVIFGLYPARRAASMDPVEALRHE
jgi:putative ABC transport system permease protein